MVKALVVKRRKRRTGDQAKGGVSKAQAIRNTAKKLGRKVRPKDVIAALAGEGITVSSPQVSATLKAAGYRRARQAKRAALPPAEHQTKAAGVSLEHLLAAKAMASRLGSLDAARKAIEVLAKLI